MQKVRNMIRRVAVVATGDSHAWAVEGYPGEQNELLEIFPGVGLYSRPGGEDNVEAIVLKLGSRHSVVIATRNQGQAVVLDADETAIANSQAVVHVKADGTIEARTRNGTAVSLALKSDVDAQKAHVDAHRHTYIPTSGTPGTPTQTSFPESPAGVPDPAPTPAGTAKFKGE